MGGGRREADLVALGVGALLHGADALAGPGDTFGLGARSLGRGGAGAEWAEGAEAAWLNPAALAGQEHDSFFVNYTALRAEFKELPPVYWDTNIDGTINEDDEPLHLDTPGGAYDGVQLGLRRGLGKRVAIGLAAFLPKDRLLRISSTEPSLPDYFLYNRRLQRFELAAGAGVDVFRGLHLGAGAQVLAKATVEMVGRLQIDVTGADEGDEDMSGLISNTTFDMSSIDLDVKPVLLPVVAVDLDVGRLVPALQGLYLGGTWRGSGGLPVDIDVDLELDANVKDVGDLDPIALALLARLEMAFLDHAEPSRWTAAAAYGYKRRVLATVDVTGTNWQDVVPSVTQIDEDHSTLESPLFQQDDPSVSDGNAYKLVLERTLGVRTGAEVALLDRDLDKKVGFLRVALRGGFGYEPSPLVSQGNTSAFLDADRLLFSAGLGVEHGDPTGHLDGPVDWDLFFQEHLLAGGELDRSLPAYQAGGPVDGAPIPIGGHLMAAGLQWSIAY